MKIRKLEEKKKSNVATVYVNINTTIGLALLQPEVFPHVSDVHIHLVAIFHFANSNDVMLMMRCLLPTVIRPTVSHLSTYREKKHINTLSLRLKQR